MLLHTVQCILLHKQGIEPQVDLNYLLWAIWIPRVGGAVQDFLHLFTVGWKVSQMALVLGSRLVLAEALGCRSMRVFSQINGSLCYENCIGQMYI